MEIQKEIVSCMMDILELVRQSALKSGNMVAMESHYDLASERLRNLLRSVENQ